MNYRKAILTAPRTFQIVEEELPALKPNEVLLKVVSIGLCHSDMPTYLGQSAMGKDAYGHSAMVHDVKFPTEIGHETVGIVAEVGSAVTRFAVGDYAGCTPRTPGFASHRIVAEDAMVPIPKEVKELKYCLVEPLMCVANIVQAANPKFGDTVGVVGCGMMGLLTIAGLSRSGASKVIALDVQDDRLELAKKYGATHTINPTKGDLVAEVNRVTDNLGADVVVEISGSLRGLKTALKVVRYANLFGYEGRGKVLIPSLYSRPEQWDPEIGYDLMFRAPILHSTHPSYSENYMQTAKAAVDGYISGTLPLRSLITHEFSLDNIAEGFETLEHAKGGYLKGIIVP